MAKQTKAFVIRDFTPIDLSWVVDRHVMLYREEYGFDESFRQYVHGPVMAFYESFKKGEENLWIAEEEGVPVGMIAIVKADPMTAQLRWFLIEPEARGKGLGNLMMQTAVDFTREKGYSKLFLWTVSQLDVARYLYEKFGFYITEVAQHEIWGNVLKEERWDLNF
jgi:GNAT superfamily N-acetyltransferase